MIRQPADFFVARDSADRSKVKISSTGDGTHWTPPVVVDKPSSTHVSVNVDVAAYASTVAVSYGLTNPGNRSKFGQQFIAVSRNGGATFAPSIAVGPRSDYRYAARAPVIFPGDYIGTALSRTGRLYAVWCVSSAPADPDAMYHQVVYGAVLST